MSNLLLVDTETDIEQELDAGDHLHAIPVCTFHRGPAWFPIAGTIVEAVCGKLFRWRSQKDNAKKCKPCGDFHGRKFNCSICGREIYG